MSIVGSIITMLLMLSVLTVVHEWGHYIAARAFKIKVNEFAIFFGPKIYSRVSKKTGTVFSIRCIPMGGFCSLEGEEKTVETESSFSNSPWYKRAVILLAGVTMNFILAILILTIIFSVAGYNTTYVSTVGDDRPVTMTSLEAGDKITDYNGKSLLDPLDYDLFKMVEKYEDEPDSTFTVVKKDGSLVEYKMIRDIRVDEETKTMDSVIKVQEIREGKVTELGTYTSAWYDNEELTVTMEYADGTKTVIYYLKEDGKFLRYTQKISGEGDTGKVKDEEYSQIVDGTELTLAEYMIKTHDPYKYGFSFSYYVKGNIFEVIGHSFSYSISLVKSVLYTLWWLITGSIGVNAVSGPIGLTGVVSSVITADAVVADKILTLLNFTALISANLAVFNLLPIPGLDGGKMLFILIELIRKGKKVPPEKEAIVSLVFFALLILFAIFIAGNDILRIVKG